MFVSGPMCFNGGEMSWMMMEQAHRKALSLIF